MTTQIIHGLTIRADGDRIIDCNGNVTIGTIHSLPSGSHHCTVIRPYAAPLEWQHDYGRERAIAAVVLAYKRHVEGVEKPYQAMQSLEKPDTIGGLSIT